MTNYNRNQEWFVEGKHYFRIKGEELKKWRLTISLRDSQIGSKARYLLISLRGQKTIDMRGRSLILWTQRGVGQHARMINTPEAWTISDMLNDYYFDTYNRSASRKASRKARQASIEWQIARWCKVSQPFVGKIRGELHTCNVTSMKQRTSLGISPVRNSAPH